MTVTEGAHTATGKITYKDSYHRSCAPNGAETVTRDVEVDVSCVLDKDLPTASQCDVYHCNGSKCYVYSWTDNDLYLRITTDKNAGAGATTTERPWSKFADDASKS